ncbi:hypothetical protein ACTHSZ_10730, partial [Neisseria sp. P0006.S006]
KIICRRGFHAHLTKTALKFSIYDTVGTLYQKYSQTRSNPTLKYAHTVALLLYILLSDGLKSAP